MYFKQVTLSAVVTWKALSTDFVRCFTCWCWSPLVVKRDDAASIWRVILCCWNHSKHRVKLFHLAMIRWIVPRQTQSHNWRIQLAWFIVLIDGWNYSSSRLSTGPLNELENRISSALTELHKSVHRVTVNVWLEAFWVTEKSKGCCSLW